MSNGVTSTVMMSRKNSWFRTAICSRSRRVPHDQARRIDTQNSLHASDFAGAAEKQEDAEAWRTFIDLYTPLVYRYCRMRGLQDADSRDVTQQVLASVHRAIGAFEYDSQRGRFRNWLGTITQHEMLRHVQKDRRPGKGMGAGQGDSVARRQDAPVDAEWQVEFNAHIFTAALALVRPHFESGTRALDGQVQVPALVMDLVDLA